MEVATFWQIGEKRVCTGGHESDGYPWYCRIFICTDVVLEKKDIVEQTFLLIIVE